VLLVILLSLPFFTEWKLFGVLLIMVQEMFVDVVKWLLLLIIVLFAFSFCLIGFERAGWYVHETDDGEQLVGHPITRPDGAFWAPFWVVYGDVNPDAYRSMLESGTGWLIWSYSMVASVILVNLLVAMMADTYARVQAHAEGMYIYQKYIRTFAHRHLHTVVPPPFNLPWTLFDVITVKSGCRKPWRLPVPTQRGFADGSALLQAYKEAMRTSAAVEMGQLLGRLERALWDQREESAELLERKLSKLEKAMRDEMHEQSCQVTDEIRELVQGSSKRRHHSHRT